MRAIQFLVIFSLIFNSPFATAAETSGGAKQSSSAGNRKPSSSQESSDVKLQKSSCPALLKDWVKDDYTDKSTLMVFKFNSEAKTCNSSVTAYQNYMSGKGVQTQYEKPESLSAEFGKQFSSTISSEFASSVNGCNSSEDLNPEQKKVIQTRFYAAATRMEGFNKSALDEIAFIDSVTEGASTLEGIECPKYLPEVKSSCSNLKAQADSCRNEMTAAKRLDEQVAKTVAALGKIERLKEAETKCKMSSFVKCAGSTADCAMRGGFTLTSQKEATKKCGNIAKAIEVIKDDVPWVRGDIFDKIAREKAKPRSSARNYLGPEKIKEALKEQLKANRTALATAYKDNLQNFRCLIYDNSDKNEKCDFEKLRTELAKLDPPKIPQLEDKRANMEFKTYYDAESCLLDRHEDRAGTKSVVDNAAVDAGLTIVTAGLGSIAAGAKVIGGLSKTAIATRRGAFAGALAVDGYYAQGSTKQAYKSCMEASPIALEKLSVQEKQKNIVCENAKSQVSIARETSSGCLVDSLLAGADLLPFVGGAVPFVARAVKSTDAPSASTVTPTTPVKSEVAAGKAEQTGGNKSETKPKDQKPADQPASDTKVADTKGNGSRKPAGKPADKPADKPSDTTQSSNVDTPVETPVAGKTSDQPAPTVSTEKPTPPVIASNDSSTPNPDLSPSNGKLTAEKKAELRAFTEEAPPKQDTTQHTAVAGKPSTGGTANGAIGAAGKAAGNLADQFANLHQGQRYTMPDPTGSGHKINAQFVGMAGTRQNPQVEMAYQKADGSMASRNVEVRDFLESNPEVRHRLGDEFYKIMSNGRDRQADLAAVGLKPSTVQTSPTQLSYNNMPTPSRVEVRSSNNVTGMSAAAPSAPRVEQPRLNVAMNQPTPTVQLNTGGGSGGSIGSSGGGSTASVDRPRSSEGGGSRSPASVQPAAADSTTQIENELMAALSGRSSAAPPIAKSRPQPVSIFNTSNSSSNKASAGSAKEVLEETGAIDTTTNARFVEGEKIRVANFEGGKDAEFTVVKKLDNGSLRVSDDKGKEFDLLRSEVKTAERLSLNGAPDPLLNVKPVATPAKIGNNLPPGELVRKAATKVEEAKLPEDVKLKEEFIRPGDKVTVNNFEGGGDLKASVVKKNADGTVRVKDENGKEFDLIKSEVKGAEFSRELPAEVKQNLEIADEAERVKTAQNYLNRSLTPTQEDALVKSHKIAGDKGIYSLSKTDLKQKTKVLRDAGFTDEEASLLLRKGVTGGTGLDEVRIVSQQAAVPKFEIVKGKQIQVPMGNTGRTNPGAVMSGPDKYGYYEVEFYQKGVGIGRARKTAKELTEANVQLPPKVDNPVINVPVVGKDVSYPGKVINGPNAKGQYEVEIYPPGQPVTVVRMNEADLKRANTPLALRQAKIRDARRASFAKKSSAELEQIVSDSLRQAEGRGTRDRYDVSYGSSGKPDKTLKAKKIDIDGQKALEELAKRQSKEVNALYEEMKLARKSVPQVQGKKSSVSSMSAGDIYNSQQAGGARNELDFLAEQDGLKGSKFNSNQFDNMARELGITDANRASAMDYGSVANRKETRELFERLFPGQKTFDQDMLRQTMSYNPRGGYIGAREFANAEKFVEAVQRADVSQLTLSERRLLNKYTDRAPLYARQANPDVALLPRLNVEVDAVADAVTPSVSRKVASVDGPALSAMPTARSQIEDAGKTAGEARNRLDYLAEQDGLKGSRLNPRQRESVARELGIYDENKTAALDYASVGTKKEVNALFDKIFPGKKEFDVELLRQSMSYNPRGGYVNARDFSNAEKFVEAVRKADVDGSTLSLSERRLLNRFTDRAPLYARQVTPETPSIPRQSLEAIVPPRITNDKVTDLAARGDEIVAQATLKPEMARAGDQVQLKNFEGGDLNATFVRRNKDGTVRVKDSRGKEFNLNAQASGDAKFYRGLTAELKVNGDLDPAARVSAAQAYVKRHLTQAQKDAVLTAHDVGGAERGFFDYTAKDLRDKTEILRKSGFTTTETSLLLRKGIAGNNPAELAKVIKVEPSDVRVGDRVTIDQFNGTGELRGEIVGPAKNGGMILREANGTETIIYKADLDDATNTRITRDPNRRTIASSDETLTLNKAPIKAVNTFKKPVPVEASEARIGDRVVISEFNGTGELDGFIVGPSKNGGFVLREANGAETTIYKTDLADTTNAKVLREWGTKLPESKTEMAAKIDFSADSPVLVTKDMKNNPEIVVPLGNGELRQGHVLSKVEAKPGLAKTYVVEYADETGVINQVHLTQEQLLAANTPEALKKVKADVKRSTEYQAKSNTELQQILDEGHRAAKEAVGKGRPVDKMDLNAEPQTALSELARRSQVTSRAVFEAYKRGGVKGVEALAQAKDTARTPASIVSPAVTPVIVKPLSQLKTGDYVVTAGVGDKVKLPKPVGSETEGLVLGRDKVNNEIIYTVGVKKDNSVLLQKMTDRELGDANSSFVGIKPERARSSDPQAIRAQIENDFANAKNEAQLAELRAKSRKKVEAKNSVTYDDSTNPLLEGSYGVTTPEGAIYINTDRGMDERFSTLLHEVSHTRTDRVKGDLSLKSKSGALSAQGYEKGFSLDEVKAATVNFAVDKQTVITQSKAGRPGVPNRAVKRDIENMQTSIDRRQAFINDTRESLDHIDDSLGSLVAKDVGRSGNANFTIWQVTLNDVPGKTGPVKVNFSTPVNMSRSEAMGQLREFSRQERINMLNAQSRLDYDKAYLTELRAKVGVPKRPEPLKGGSFLADTRVNSRNPASDKVKAQAADANPQMKDLVNELDSVLAVRGRNYGLRDVNELTSGHPLTPTVEKQRQIMSRLNRIDRQLQPENFSRMTSNIANDFAKTGDMDLAIPYYRASADTVYESLGSSAKSFWSNEANAKAAIRAGFISDNNDVARMATEKLVLAKAKSVDQNEIKKVALDQYYNLGYEYDRILYGVKRYGNKNKEVDLLVIRKQQQFLSQKYKLKDDIESAGGKEAWQKMEEQADLTVEDLLSNPAQIIDPDKFKKTQRVPASAPAAEVPPPPSSRLPVEQKVEGRVSKSSAELEAQVDTYVESLKGADLSPKEVKSILHQQDLITATRNPVVAKVMSKAEVDFQGLKFGMLDSDVGKIAKFQENLLLKNTKESEELFDTIRGTAQTPATKEVKSILADLGFAHPSLLNPEISNQEIRDIIAEVPVLRGYLHELPGMQLAIRDLNAGNITSQQFRERFLANLGHNGPDDGFWGILSGSVVPTSLANAKHPKAKVFFANSIFDHGEKLPSGVVKPKYPMPQTTAGIVHSTFDRLSQGTRGGIDKIFYELGGAPLAANPKAAIREIGVQPNKGLQLPNEMLIGNPEKTVRQLEALQKHAATSKQLNKVQQAELSQFVGGAIHRLEKQNEYIKEHVELARDVNGLVERMTLKFTDELGNEKKLVFTNDSPAADVAKGMERMLLHEERLHGEPFKNFKITQPKPALSLASTEAGKLDQRHAQASLDYLIVNIAKRSDNEKADAPEVVEFLKAYKNDPGFATWLKTKEVPNAVHYDVKGNAQKLLGEFRGLERKPTAIEDRVTVNLADSHLQEPSRLNAWQTERQINFKRSQYDNVVSSLKKGDVVQAPSATSGKVENFELGEYIGAGNTSNLYAMKDSNKVLRLPYLTSGVSGKKTGKEFLETYVKTRDKYEGIPGLEVVKVYDHGKNYEYIVNERVSIRMTLNQVEDRLYTLKSGKKLSAAEEKEFNELQAVWDKFAKMAPEIAKRSNDPARVSSLQSPRADVRDMALVQEARQVALTPDGRLVLLDWE
ncbi:hypothetical protein [Pseudobdellovibrio sp. HCB154]|uniref:hypothetical protein n=1 Tax=Pseudobdellovibrio sp. HCB154 TaxID=3386277 RepID=UPI0039173DF7